MNINRAMQFKEVWAPEEAKPYLLKYPCNYQCVVYVL